MNKTLKEAVLEKLIYKDGVVFRKTAGGYKPIPVDGEHIETKVGGMKLKTTLPSLCYLLQTKEWVGVVTKVNENKPLHLDNLRIGKKPVARLMCDSETDLTTVSWKEGNTRKQKTYNSYETDNITYLLNRLKDYEIRRKVK